MRCSDNHDITDGAGCGENNMIEENSIDNIVQVSLMGEMTIEFQGRILRLQELHSKRIILFLAYLFYHHDRRVVMTELIDVIWGDIESKNPKGALKNLMYRSR